MTQEPGSRSLCALTLCAFSVPAVMLLPRLGWLWTLLSVLAGTGVLAAGAFWRARAGKTPVQSLAAGGFGRVALGALLVWNWLALGGAARLLCLAFPDGNGFPLVGLLLLLLAVQASAGKTDTVLRMGGVLVLFLAGFYGIVLLFSLPQVQARWLRPVLRVDAALLPCALTPMLALFLPVRGREKAGLWCAAGGIVALGAAVLCAGALSPQRVAGDGFAFYTAVGGARLFGTLERMEALVSVAVCLGGFCLMALLCAVNHEVLAALGMKKEKRIMILQLFAGSAAMAASCALPEAFFAIGTTIFWGFLPIVTLLVEIRKKFKKS